MTIMHTRSGLSAFVLPLAAAGLAALLPWRAVPVLHAAGLLQPAAMMTGRPGMTAIEVVAPTLSAPLPAGGTTGTTTAPAGARPAPLGDDRPADGKLLAEVARRQAELDRREHQLETRSVQLEAATKLARQEMSELGRLRAEIEKLVIHESVASTADLDLLVGLYANMKPPQAAAVLAKLEPPKAAAILQKLDTRAAGPILAAMDPTAALAITEEVAQRRATFRQ